MSETTPAATYAQIMEGQRVTAYWNALTLDERKRDLQKMAAYRKEGKKSNYPEAFN